MADYTLSQAADADYTAIYIYTFQNFGETQADSYTLALETCLQNLAQSPRLGRIAGDEHENCLSYIHSHHAIYYRPTETGIHVLRILHQRRDSELRG